MRRTPLRRYTPLRRTRLGRPRKYMRRKTARQRTIQELDRLVRERVLTRDKHSCQKCGKTSQLQAAHVFPKGRYPHLRFEEYNLITLCIGCHLYWAHKDPIGFHDWLEVVEPGKIQRLREMDATAPKVDVKLLLTVLRAEASKR